MQVTITFYISGYYSNLFTHKLVKKMFRFLGL